MTEAFIKRAMSVCKICGSKFGVKRLACFLFAPRTVRWARAKYTYVFEGAQVVSGKVNAPRKK